MFSPDTVALFEELLNSYSLPSNHPQFALVAQRISNAKSELVQFHQEPDDHVHRSAAKVQTQEEVLAENPTEE